MHQSIGHQRWRSGIGHRTRGRSLGRHFALQEYFSHHDDSKQVNRRLLHDALNEKFHHKGDLAYLYRLLPGVPIVQGCRLAGLEGTTRQCGPVLRQHLITACIFNPETWGVLRRSTANRFESIHWVVRLLIASRRGLPAVVRLLSI